MISFYRFSSPPPTHSPTIPRDTVKDATDVGVGGGGRTVQRLCWIRRPRARVPVALYNVGTHVERR